MISYFKLHSYIIFLHQITDYIFGMKICSLGSGSSGNSFYIEGSGTRILVDVGFNLTEIERRLAAAEISPADLNGIIITHEHADHVCGLRLFVKKWKIPFYVNNLTLDAIKKILKDPDVNVFYNSMEFAIGNLNIQPFPVLHDASCTSGFVISNGTKKIFYATDIGFVTFLVKERMKNANAIIFESNHDKKMLVDGKYPWFLKQRILGRQGHISNEESAMAIRDIINDSCSRIILAHISKENNDHRLALDTHRKILGNDDIPIHLAEQNSVSKIYNIR